MKNTNEFLAEHKTRSTDFDIHQMVELFIKEMQKGFEVDNGSLRMIPTYIEADNEFLINVTVTAIDAGGTNFRAAKVKFNNEGKLEMGEIINNKMPGIDKKMSKVEFFETFAGYIKTLADESERIGFCFSYPTEIFPNKDGKLLQFSKEVQAPEVVGEMVGKNLLETLKTPNKPIVLLNDTVATLLAGKSASFGKTYDSFIGFILGTGTNTCYIESNSNIKKTPSLNKSKSLIINIESGNFNGAPFTDLDIAFDNTTGTPGQYSFEKMFSGGYFGGLCLSVLKTAAKEGVFSTESAKNISELNQLTTEDVNHFVNLKSADRGPLQGKITNAADEESCVKIIECLIDRSAKLVAANMAAVVLKSNKGKSADRPILITIEGTTFYKLYNLKSSFEKYLDEYLSGERKRYIEFIEVANSSLVGAALSALID